MKQLAELFYIQCVGSYSGHMASIPNNPLMSSIFYAVQGREPDRKEFAKILKSFADELEKAP